MRPAKRWTDPEEERGSAPIEFIFAGLVLLAPLVYLMVALGAVQAHALGAETGSRHIARAVATAADAEDARERVDAVLSAIVREYGMDPTRIAVALDCRPAAVPCPSPGTTLMVTLTSRVALPLVPEVLGLDELASIPIEARSVQKVSRFWGAS